MSLNNHQKNINWDRVLAIISTILAVLGFLKDYIPLDILLYLLSFLAIAILFKYLSKKYSEKNFIKKLRLNSIYRGFLIIPLFLVFFPFLRHYFGFPFINISIAITLSGTIISIIYWKLSKSNWITLHIFFFFSFLFIIENVLYEYTYDQSFKSLKIIKKEDFKNQVLIQNNILCEAFDTSELDLKRSHEIKLNRILIYNSQKQYVDQIKIVEDSSNIKIKDVLFDPNNRFLVVGLDRAIQIWDIKNKKPIYKIPLYYNDNNYKEFKFDYINNEMNLVIYYRDLKIDVYKLDLNKLDLNKPLPKKTFNLVGLKKNHFSSSLKDEPLLRGNLHDILILNDGQTIIIETSRETVVWKNQGSSLDLFKIFPSSGSIIGNYISEIESGDKSKIFRVDSDSIHQICEIQLPSNLKFESELNYFSDNGRFYIAGVFFLDNASIRKRQVFDSNSCELIASSFITNDDNSYFVSFSPDNRLVATYVHSMIHPGNIIKIYNVSERKLLKSFVGHKNAIHNLEFSNCSNYLYSGSDNEFKIWDL